MVVLGPQTITLSTYGIAIFAARRPVPSDTVPATLGAPRASRVRTLGPAASSRPDSQSAARPNRSGFHPRRDGWGADVLARSIGATECHPRPRPIFASSRWKKREVSATEDGSVTFHHQHAREIERSCHAPLHMSARTRIAPAHELRDRRGLGQGHRRQGWCGDHHRLARGRQHATQRASDRRPARASEEEEGSILIPAIKPSADGTVRMRGARATRS